MSQAISQDQVALNNWINVSGSTKEQVTFTVYDIADPIIAPLLVDITDHTLPLISEHSLPVFQSKVYQSVVGWIRIFQSKVYH